MKKCLVFIFCLVLLLVGKIYSQTSPPLYETEEEEPKDLAIEKPAPKKKLAPQPEQPKETPPAEIEPEVKEEPKPETKPAQPQTEPKKEEVTQPEPKLESEEKLKVEAKEEVPLPPPPPPPPEITVPSDVSVVQVKPFEEATTELQDGGPLKDAGGDLPNALVIAYSRYESNFLSPSDLIDIFKIFTRPQEGIGVILKPKQTSTQFACELVGEQGELLSQTQAAAAGETLAFQTSPFEKNGMIYLRVRDLSLLPDSPATEQREYSLELKPIAAILPPPPPFPEQPSPTQSPAKKQEKPMEEPPFQLPANFWQYGLAGGAVLVLVVFLLILIRRRRRRDEDI